MTDEDGVYVKWSIISGETYYGRVVEDDDGVFIVDCTDGKRRGVEAVHTLLCNPDGSELEEDLVDVIKVEVPDMLDLVSSATDYGYTNPVLLSTFAEWLGELTDKQIEQFARSYLTPEMRKHGYNEEDYEHVKERLTDFRSQYMS